MYVVLYYVTYGLLVPQVWVIETYHKARTTTSFVYFGNSHPDQSSKVRCIVFLTRLRGCHCARQITSPDNFIWRASRASSHSFSLSFVFTTAISPNARGFIVWALRPEHSRRSSDGSKKIRLLGLLMSDMPRSTGRSSRYLRSAHILR